MLRPTLRPTRSTFKASFLTKQCWFQSPRVSRVWPLIGPRAGGTDVTITGSELDTGNDLQVLFDNASCRVNRLVERVFSTTT